MDFNPNGLGVIAKEDEETGHQHARQDEGVEKAEGGRSRKASLQRKLPARWQVLAADVVDNREFLLRRFSFLGQRDWRK